MKQNIKVLDCQLEINLTDTDFCRRLDDARATYSQIVNSVDVTFPGDDYQAMYKRMEACVFATCAFFDAVFGDGTADRIFKDSNDAELCMLAMQDLGREIDSAQIAACRRINREMRRGKQKHNHHHAKRYHN